MTELGKTLKARRVALGLTARQVHAAGGPSPAVLSKIENGHDGNYSAMTWSTLSRALGWGSDGIVRLMSGEDPDPASYESPASVDPVDVGGLAAQLRSTSEQMEKMLRLLVEVLDKANALVEGIDRRHEVGDDA